jgi:phosphoglucosamine mutase
LVKQAEAQVQADGGRVLLRYSGTEPKARLLIEGRNKETLELWSQRIVTVLKQQVGA